MGKKYDPIAFPCESQKLKNLKTAIQIGGNVFNGMVNNLATKGKVDPFGLAADMATGMLQGQIGTNMRDDILGVFGLGGSRLATAIVGTAVDTTMDWGMSELLGQDFDLGQSLGWNSAANLFAAYVPDPVDAVTGAYTINATDFILASLPAAMKVERRYRSTSGKDSVFGRGWSFPYASRIFRDTGDMARPRIHLETVTGHSLCFGKQGDSWTNQCRGTGRFSVEVREGAGFPEKEAFLLTDVVEHTLSAYDRQGRLSYVEYPNGIRTVLAYGEEGLEQIVTPVGNVLEVVCEEGHILQITDEIGRRTQYRYKDGCLTDVVHTDEGITHYEYDEGGRIKSVTDQNGSRYLENEYDEKGRIVRQCFASGVYQTFAYDDAHRRNTVYFSESGKREVYEYNDQLLVERTVYDDSTAVTCTYSEDNMKTSETSRQGYRKEWEYDGFGRVVLEKSPDGYQVCHEYDGNHDLVRTWDTDGCEALLTYDSAHNLILLREKISEGRWRETSKAYDSMGRCIRERDALGNETIMEYGPSTVHPVRVITPKGEETACEYDIVGRRMAYANVYGTVEFTYNSRNLITKRIDGEGHEAHWFYDQMGRLRRYYPPEQWRKQAGCYTYHYDFMQRLEDTVTPLEEHQRVFRNFDGNIIRRIHPVSYALKGESGEGICYEYDHDGNCIRIYYPDGGVERMFYDADGNMIKQVPPESYVVADDDGEGTTYGYDACGRLSVVKDQDGSILKTYEYNGHGNLVREVDGEGGEKLYYYNGLGLKIREEVQVRKEGEAFYRVVTYAYDNQGNKVEEAYGCQETVRGGSPETWHSIHFSYDANNRLVSIKDDYGAQEKYDYDCLGKKITEERVIEEGTYQKIQYKYDRNGRRIGKQEEIQGNGSVKIAVTTYGYDGNGNLVLVKTPKGFSFHREYDGDDRLKIEHITDKRNGIDCSVIYTYNEIGKITNIEVQGRGDIGGKTSYRYDLKDRMTHQINARGAVVRYIYNKNDQITARICPYGYDERTDSGIGTSYSYDSRGNCKSITNALGEKIEEAHYNLCDHLDMSRDALGNMTTYEYRLDGQVSTISRDYGGHKRTLQQYEYNARGQIVGIIDGNQERVSYDTDGWGKITRIGYSDGVEETYRYIPAGQACTAVDGNGNQVQYLYNSMGKVRERIDQLGERETFLYDAEGNLSLHIDRDGRKVSRDYNVFGDPVYERAVDADGENVCISTWHYDSIGRIIRAVCNGHSYEYRYDSYGNLQEKCSNGSLLVSYAYDKAGQVKEIKDRNGICTLYGYDVLGRKERIYNNQGLDIRYSYDSQNRLQKIVYGNGVETHYTYDGDGNIGSLETKTADCILLSLRYQYDGNGNRTAKKGIRHELARTMEPKVDEAINAFYRYNIRGQLLEESNGNDVISYTYDAAGNRIKKTDVYGETYYAFNRKNQLVCMEGPKGITRYIYDKEGGITAEENPEGIRRYSYNSLHQQIWVCTEDGNVQENRYDAEGLRYEMSENGKQHRFIYHDQELLSEQTEGGGWTSYHLGGLGIDAACQDNKLLYYHKDEQNSTAYLTDGEGKVVNSYQYDAFGNNKEVTEKLFNRIRYAGQQYDCNTKQYYLRARYYSPAVGRFMQEDAYWGDGLNLYAYCNNNPVVYYDPSGYGLQEYLDVLAVWKDDIIEYWGKGFYSTYKERMHRTPVGQYKKTGAVKGNWEGDRGESMYSAFDYSDAAIRANQVIYQYGQKGITYSNGEPNFRPVSEAVVSIGNMMGDRYAEDGNFSQADKALAKYLNENPNCDLYEKMGVSGKVTEKDIKQYRKDNNLTWHEENDGVHMDLVSKDVNAIYGHLGGTAEQKRKEDGIEYNVEEDC